MSGIFKAYDIRGIYPTELDEEIVRRIGRAYADMLIQELKKDKVTVVVGQDMRVSSPSLAESLIGGITEQGANVIDIGLASTPTFYYGVSFLSADGGMQVSASHNPKEYNGIKIVGRKAFPVGYDSGMNMIEGKVRADDFADSNRIGTVTKREGILESEVDFSLRSANPDAITPLKVVADPANAMGAPYLTRLFSRLPCELIEMNFSLDGTFPSHQADPFKAENVVDLSRRVIEEQADMGIATDGDGDRIFFMDEKGQLIEPAILRGLLARIVLKENPGARICYDIRPGRITRDMIGKHGGIPSMTKVGHTLIKIQAIEENAAFAGESSGHFFFNTDMGLFEMPMIVTLKLLEEICTIGRPVSEIIDPLRVYHHSGEINSTVEDKEAKMKEIAALHEDAKISWLDGVSVEYGDYWFNVRPSNTEPLLRLNLEAVSKELMESRCQEVLDVIRG